MNISEVIGKKSRVIYLLYLMWVLIAVFSVWSLIDLPKTLFNVVVNVLAIGGVVAAIWERISARKAIPIMRSRFEKEHRLTVLAQVEKLVPDRYFISIIAVELSIDLPLTAALQKINAMLQLTSVQLCEHHLCVMARRNPETPANLARFETDARLSGFDPVVVEGDNASEALAAIDRLRGHSPGITEYPGLPSNA